MGNLGQGSNPFCIGISTLGGRLDRGAFKIIQSRPQCSVRKPLVLVDGSLRRHALRSYGLENLSLAELPAHGAD